MGKSTVFANGRSVACKAGSGKMICAFPNVCFTPPQTPPMPLGVPLPYTNTSSASMTRSGTKNVTIGGKEVMIRDKSFFEKSKGSEAGRAPKKGFLTSKNDGKTYFAGWSFDVDFQGKNAVRHLDVTTFNHGSAPGNGGVWIFEDRIALASEVGGACAAELNRVEGTCGKKERPPCRAPLKDASKDAVNYQKNECQRAARCLLVPFNKSGSKKRAGGCCPPQTPHHLIPKACFYKKAFRRKADLDNIVSKKYNYYTAPCICVEGSNTTATHGLFHAAHGKAARALVAENQPYTFEKACDIGAKNVTEVLKSSGCGEACIKAQLLRGGHKDVPPDTELMANRSKTRSAVGKRLEKLKKFQIVLNMCRG